MVDEFTVFVTMPGTADQWSGRFHAPATAGRSESCDIHLPHPLVSRQHAVISRLPDGDIVVRDLGSTNGTIVGDTVLRDGDLQIPGRASVNIGPFFLVVTTDVPLHETTWPGDKVAAASSEPPAGAGGPTGTDFPYPSGLSAREVQVLRLIAAGRTNAEIAEELVISPHTVSRHVSNIFAKTGAANRAEAAAFAVERQLTASP